jgi:hypothetical protein
MRKLLSFLIASLFCIEAYSQCTTSNATGCSCADGTNACQLLPDITVSWAGILNYKNGPNEYSQTGNGANDGRLRLTGATPNIGYGPLTVRGVDRNGYRWFLCGTDTFSIHDPQSNTSFSCPNGNSNPQQMILQRIYEKNGNTMSFTERFSGTMTYHPTHGHNHVDDWVTFTLRIEDPNNTDTLSWAIVGEGAKIGFCLMDYGSCDNQTTYAGFCRDNQKYNSGNILMAGDFPNYGLGGGQYNCSQIQQGISSGWHDVYDEDLDGMWINIPPTTCNGNYWIVVEVDPANNFVESREDNNWTAVPYTLTKQLPAGAATASVSMSGDKYLCNSETVTLTANTALSYMWSNGETNQSITVSDPGNYTVQTTSICGTATSAPVEIVKNIADFNELKADTSCDARAMTLTAKGTGIVRWFDESSGGVLLDTGETFITPVLHATTTYYAEIENVIASQTDYSQPQNHAGNNFSGNTFNGTIQFDAFQSFNLVSVKVYTDLAGTRIIELRDNNGTVLQSVTVNIPSGTSRVTLNFSVPAATGLQLGANEASNQTTFGYASPRLRRSDSGVSYPYVLNGILSLNGSPYGASYYYYFYDWEVNTSVSCTSARVPLTALVDNIPAVSLSGLDAMYELHSSGVTLVGIPSGGTFSGPGVTGNVFNPADAGVGVHEIFYIYSDPFSGCSNFATDTVEVFENPTGIKASQTDNYIRVYPNPANDFVNIEVKNISAERITLRIFNAVGELVTAHVLHIKKGMAAEKVNTTSFSRGIYFGEISSASGTSNFRFLKQ